MAPRDQQPGQALHSTPLVDSGQGYLTVAPSAAQSLFDAGDAMSGSDDDPGLAHLNLAGSLEHGVGGRQKDEGIHILLQKGAAEFLESGKRAGRLVHHHDRHEQSMGTGHGLDGRD